MELKQVTSLIVTAIFAFGLFMAGAGLAFWVYEKFQELNVSWQITLVALGLILLIFGGMGVKLFSRE